MSRRKRTSTSTSRSKKDLDPEQIKPSDIERFMDKVLEVEHGCWVWTAAKQKAGEGYGSFWFNGRMVLAHRFAYAAFKGRIRDGYVVAHLCNNDHCCNPMHLAEQSQSENMKYCHMTGRSALVDGDGWTVEESIHYAQSNGLF